MDINKAKQLFSNERIAAYEKIAKKYHKDPLELYLLNTQASGAFHFPLHICEVALRNTIDSALSSIFTHDWHINLLFQRMIDGYQRDKLLTSIDKNKRNGVVPKGKIIAELTLGFWINLLSPKYAQSIWSQHFYGCFANYQALNPRSTNPANAQNALYAQLKALNKFRNRIAHYEPIIKGNLQAEYQRIITIISYIDIVFAKWVQANQQLDPSFV
jgi:hypothetical protein